MIRLLLMWAKRINKMNVLLTIIFLTGVIGVFLTIPDGKISPCDRSELSIDRGLG